VTQVVKLLLDLNCEGVRPEPIKIAAATRDVEQRLLPLPRWTGDGGRRFQGRGGAIAPPPNQRCRVSAGVFHQSLSRPLKYLTGASISSAGVASSSVACLIETKSPPVSATWPRVNGWTPQ
jgi:hypothetical protein